MGICCSCLRARDKTSQDRSNSETQPLLGDATATEPDSSEDNDELTQLRQQELANIVHMTHEYFIDVSGVTNTESGEQNVDLSMLAARIADRQAGVTLDVPNLEQMSAEERSMYDAAKSTLKQH